MHDPSAHVHANERRGGDPSHARAVGVGADPGEANDSEMAWTSRAPKWFAAGVLAIAIGVGLLKGWGADRGGERAGREHATLEHDGAGVVGVSVTQADLAAGDGFGGGNGGSGGSGGRIDLNRATAAELELLPGIGPSASARIVAFRETIGGFHHVDELSRVRGIGEKTLERLRSRVYVGPPPVNPDK